MQKLNFPAYNFRFKNSENKISIFDALRKKFIVLTPEEWLPPDQRSPAQGAASFASHKAVSARIAFTVPDLAPTGYRVYIFYP